jgi:SNF2 family DNA or RNA helicase
MLDYTPKTAWFKHQEKEFYHSRDFLEFAVFWEQGTGKSKLIIDTAAWLWMQGKIDAVIIVAPNSVRRNWISDEIPAHLPDDVAKQSRFHVYQPIKAKTLWHQKAVKELLGHKGLAWIAISYEAFITKAGKALMKKMLVNRRALYVLDESQRIKTPGAKRTKTIVASGRYATYKRILTGTPIANGPFDIYSPMRFLRDKFWHHHSIGSALAFRHEYGVFSKGFNGQQNKEYEYLVDYKNLTQLYDILQPISSRVLKEDVLDLPPKLYSKRYFEMSAEQKRLYEEIKEEFMAELETGELITAPLVLTRMLRLQQITCGYLPTDPETKTFHMIGESNPRLELLKEIAEDMPHQAIIWARFVKDIDLIMGALGKNAVRFDGSVKEPDREVAKKAFLNGEHQFFVGNPAVGGEGITLNAARTVVYYNNSFKLTERLQSEDRAHRIGQEHPVQYIDIMAQGTIDEHIVKALRKKFNIASQVTGDRVKEWL